jgi:2-polyprenyl-3-methyl-5-hydroxy-6-metoxy-1,4-benzoquinol methylase
MKKIIKRATEGLTHFVGKISGKYYFEDYVRVYPDGLAFNHFGKKRNVSKNDLNNYLNHCKLYQFTTQFVNKQKVADVGCGSGYGSKILKEYGAFSICGYDISKSAIKYAKSNFNDYGNFSIASITEMGIVSDNFFDVTICSEVLEHIKEYKMESRAMSELKRITKNHGLIIIATPNTELIENHGFSFDEINNLLKNKFSQYCIFENAFVPTGAKKMLWDQRLRDKSTGIIVTESINFDESILFEGNIPEIKQGLEPGLLKFDNYEIDTKLLHNTHSWIVIAINNK